LGLAVTVSVSARSKTAWTTALDRGFCGDASNRIAAAGRTDEAVRIALWGAGIEANEHSVTEAHEHRGRRLIATGQTGKALKVFTVAPVGVTRPIVRRRIPAKNR
jgi:hypothetical protein